MEVRAAVYRIYKIYNCNDYGAFVGVQFNNYEDADFYKEMMNISGKCRYVVRCEMEDLKYEQRW